MSQSQMLTEKSEKDNEIDDNLEAIKKQKILLLIIMKIMK